MKNFYKILIITNYILNSPSFTYATTVDSESFFLDGQSIATKSLLNSNIRKMKLEEDLIRENGKFKSSHFTDFFNVKVKRKELISTIKKLEEEIPRKIQDYLRKIEETNKFIVGFKDEIDYNILKESLLTDDSEMIKLKYILLSHKTRRTIIWEPNGTSKYSEDEKQKFLHMWGDENTASRIEDLVKARKNFRALNKYSKGISRKSLEYLTHSESDIILNSDRAVFYLRHIKYAGFKNDKFVEVVPEISSLPSFSEGYLASIFNDDKFSDSQSGQVRVLIRDLDDEAFVTSDKKDQAVINIIKLIEEEKKHPNFQVFYHAASGEASYLYHVFTDIKDQLAQNDTNFTWSFRGDENNFSVLKDIKELQDFVSPLKNDTYVPFPNNDSNRKFSSVAIAALPSLLINLKNTSKKDLSLESTLGLWCRDDSVGKTPRVVIKNLLQSLGFSDVEAEETEKQYWSIYEQNKIGGRLFQIFINSKVVNDVVYLSRGWGVPYLSNLKEKFDTNSYLNYLKESSDVVKKNPEKYFEDLQARIYVDPKYMADTSLVKIYEKFFNEEDEAFDKVAFKKMQKLTARTIGIWLNKYAEKPLLYSLKANAIKNNLKIKEYANTVSNKTIS